jgi:cation:H+ antiporter
MEFSPTIIFIAGLIILTLGSELILRGSSRIAALLGIRPIIIGLTVISVGTSLPELAVGITAVHEGNSGLAIGNIAGTNIVNISLILGLSASIRALKLQMRIIKVDVIMMIITSVLLFVMALNGVLTKLEGVIMVVLAIVYFIYIIQYSRKERYEVQKEYAEEYAVTNLVENRSRLTWILNSIILLAGMALTVLGAEFLVSGASSIARSLGVSDAIIGLTIVAIGTSAPELVTTLVATFKDDRDVAVGNLIGSSITNVLVILGLTCIASSDDIQVSAGLLWFDLPLAALVAIVCYPVFKSDRMVSRKEGILFVIAYLIYLGATIFFRT